MLSINTNLPSLIAQNSLKTSTNKLNIAIERMSTGFKVNSAKDNAANNAIITNLTTQIGAYDIAEENVASGLDLLATANDNLDIIEDRLQRLRVLSEQAANGTYGEASLKAINAECNSLVDEINRLYLTTEYNGAKLFIENTGNSGAMQQIKNADKNTTFEELGIGASSFSVIDNKGNTVETYDTEAGDTINDLFNTLKAHGFVSSISAGKITINSSDGYYIRGNLADSLGITTQDATYTASSSQTSTTPVTFKETITASATTTFAELGINNNSTITIKNKLGEQTAAFTINSTDNINALLNSLSANGINGTINNGVISLNSTSGNYAEGSVLNTLGINTQNSNVITLTSAATLDNKISEVYNGTNLSVTVTNQKTGDEKVFTLSQNATFADLQNNFKNNSITMTMTDGVIRLTSADNTFVTKGDILTDFGISISEAGTFTVTTGKSMTSTVSYEIATYTTSTTTTILEPTVGFVEGTTHKDVSGIVSLFDLASSDYSSIEGTFSISTTEDLWVLCFIATNLDTVESFDFSNTTFILGNDIDFSPLADSIDVWSPLGTEKNPFNGVFDGNGYTISNIAYIKRDGNSSDCAGFFGYCESATIKNLGIENIDASGYAKIMGGIAAHTCDTTIENCYTTGSISGVPSTEFAGGLVGIAEDGTVIYKSSSGVEIASNGQCYGGLAGSLFFSTIRDSYSTGSLWYAEKMGGLVGHSYNSEIINSYHSIGVINGGNQYAYYDTVLIGGLVGYAEGDINISSSYSTGNLFGGGKSSGYTAGLVGYMKDDTTSRISLVSCYVTGTIDGKSDGIYAGLLGHSIGHEFICKDTYMLATSTILDGVSAWGGRPTGITITNSYYNPNSAPNITYNSINGYEFLETDLTDGPFTHNPLEIHTITTPTTATVGINMNTKLSEIGVTSNGVWCWKNSDGSVMNITYKPTDTIEILSNSIKAMNTRGISIQDNVFKIANPNPGWYLASDSGQLLNALNLSINDAYTKSSCTLYANTNSNVQNTQNLVTTKVNTTSNNLKTTQNRTLTETTTMGELGYNNTLTITQNGTKSTISINKDTTFSSLANSLQTKGLNVSLSNGIVKITGDGISSVSSNIFNLGNTSYTTALRPENTNSDKLQYTIDVNDLIPSDTYAPGQFTIQVGIYANSDSQITFQSAFILNSVELLRNIGLEKDDYIEQIDEMLEIVSARQVEYGAVQNRLESALDEISTHYDNLVSSRSTLRDADIAEVSADYIKQQILQQASATLLSTANQSPALALQLL